MNFITLFPFLIKYYHILFIIIVFWLGCDTPSGLLLFVPVLLFSMLTPLFLPSSSVSLSYFVLAVPMRECFGKHSCMRSPCPIAILNGTFLFSRGEIVCNLGRSFVYQNHIKLNYDLIYFLITPVFQDIQKFDDNNISSYSLDCLHLTKINTLSYTSCK